MIQQATHPGHLADMLATLIIDDVPRRQRLLETTDPIVRLERIGAPYDELYCSWDKIARCVELEIDILIDDSPVNLEKVFLHTWPYNRHFDAIREKYGRAVRITNFDEEEWTVIESRSPDVRIADLVAEFGLRSHESTMESAERLHDAAWGRG